MEHWKNAYFIWFLLYIYIYSLDDIIANLKIIDNNSFSIYNNMRDPILHKN